MNIIKLAFQIFLIYLLYRFVTGFIIPIYRTSKQMKKQFREMQEKMQQQYNQNTSQPTGNNYQYTSSSTAPIDSKEGDYIEYEEIKPVKH